MKNSPNTGNKQIGFHLNAIEFRWIKSIIIIFIRFVCKWSNYGNNENNKRTQIVLLLRYFSIGFQLVTREKKWITLLKV